MNKSILIVCSLLILIASPTIAFESACKLSDSEMKALEAEITTRVIAELEAQITAKVISQLTNDADSMKAQLSGDCDWKQSLDGTTCYLEGMNVAIYNGNLILEENEGDNDISEDSKNNIVFGSGNKLHSASMSLIGGEDNQVVGVHNTILSSMDNILDADFAAIIGGEANDVRKTGTVINSVGVCVVDAGLDCLTPGQGTGNGGISVKPKKGKGKAIKPVKPTTTPKTKSKSKSKAKSKLLEQARTASRTTVISSDSSTASGGGTMISGSNSTVTGDGSTAIGTSNTCVSNGPSCPPPGTPAFLKRSLLGARTSAPTPNVAVGGTGNSIISTDGGNLIAGGVGNSITDCALSSIVGSTTSTISGPSFAKRQDGNAAVAGSTIFGSHSSTIEGSFNHISSSVLAYACEAATLTSQSSTSETCICDSGTCDSLKKKRQTSAVSFDYSQYGAGTYDPYAQRSDPNNIVGSSMSGSYGSDTTEGSSFSITSGAVGHTTYQSNAIQYVPTESFGSAGQVGNQQFEPVPYNGPAGTETCPSGQVLDPQSGHCCPTGEAWSCYYGSPCACCQIGWQFDGESCIPGF